jgi:hypothetical protein
MAGSNAIKTTGATIQFGTVASGNFTDNTNMFLSASATLDTLTIGTASTSITTPGDLTINGVLIGGTANCIGITSTPGLITLTSSSMTVTGSVSTNGTLLSTATTGNLFNTTATTLNIGGAATAIQMGLAGISTVNINGTTASIAYTSGALVVDGGVGIAGDIFTNGDLNIAGNALVDLTGSYSGQWYVKVLTDTHSNTTIPVVLLYRAPYEGTAVGWAECRGRIYFRRGTTGASLTNLVLDINAATGYTLNSVNAVISGHTSTAQTWGIGICTYNAERWLCLYGSATILAIFGAYFEGFCSDALGPILCDSTDITLYTADTYITLGTTQSLNADTIIADEAVITADTSATTFYPYFGGAGAASPGAVQGLKSSTALTYVPSTGTLTATVIKNAVWNDVVDMLEVEPDIKVAFGRAYVYTKEGRHQPSFQYAQKGCLGIASDTFGIAVGEKGEEVNQLPLAIAGVVLAHVDKVYESGTPLVCTIDGELTTARWYTRLFHSERILALFYKVENQPVWNGVEVNGRCWVKII